MTSRRTIFIKLLFLPISFLIASYLEWNVLQLQRSLPGIFPFGISGPDYSPLVVILLLTGIISLFANLIIIKSLSKRTVIVAYFVYFLAMIYMLFLPHVRAVSGISLVPFDFLRFMNGQTVRVLLLNLLMFVPLGLAVKPSAKNILRIFLLCLAIESAQLLFRVGFFDIDDILLNFAGFLIGAGLMKIKPLAQLKSYIK